MAYPPVLGSAANAKLHPVEAGVLHGIRTTAMMAWIRCPGSMWRVVLVAAAEMFADCHREMMAGKLAS